MSTSVLLNLHKIFHACRVPRVDGAVCISGISLFGSTLNGMRSYTLRRKEFGVRVYHEHCLLSGKWIGQDKSDSEQIGQRRDSGGFG